MGTNSSSTLHQSSLRRVKQQLVSNWDWVWGENLAACVLLGEWWALWRTAVQIIHLVFLNYLEWYYPLVPSLHLVTLVAFGDFRTSLFVFSSSSGVIFPWGKDYIVALELSSKCGSSAITDRYSCFLFFGRSGSPEGSCGPSSFRSTIGIHGHCGSCLSIVSAAVVSCMTC